MQASLGLLIYALRIGNGGAFNLQEEGEVGNVRSCSRQCMYHIISAAVDARPPIWHLASDQA